MPCAQAPHGAVRKVDIGSICIGRGWTRRGAAGTLAPSHCTGRCPMTDPRALQQACAGLRLKTDPADLEHYGRDWTRRWTPAPLAIALPATVEEVQAIVRWANAERVAWCRPAAAPAFRRRGGGERRTGAQPGTHEQGAGLRRDRPHADRAGRHAAEACTTPRWTTA
jgi:hypothetical protein